MSNWHGAHGTSSFGTMRVIDSDQFKGRRYRCRCGWKGWTVWGRARKHAETCALAQQPWPSTASSEDQEHRRLRSDTDLLNRTHALAAAAHAGQVDRAGQPYINHPVRVADRVHEPGAKLVALLHDVLEDTPVTVDDLRAASMPLEVIDAVQLLTRQQGETYATFIDRIAASGDRLAITVKLADLADNLDPGRAASSTPGLQRRYRHAGAVLADRLAELDT